MFSFGVTILMSIGDYCVPFLQVNSDQFVPPSLYITLQSYALQSLYAPETAAKQAMSNKKLSISNNFKIEL